jgi:hypothetical protein
MTEETKSKGAYGTVHVMEDEMRVAGQGVFEESSSEAGRKRRRKAEPPAKNKMDATPANKAANAAKGK